MEMSPADRPAEGMTPNSLMNERRALAMMPFLERTELSEIAAMPSGTTDDVLRRLQTNGFIECVSSSRVRRWCLTGPGVQRLEILRRMGEKIKELILEFSVSAQE